MVINRKVTGTASSMPAGLAVGGLVSLAVTILGSVMAANLVLREMIAESSVGYCAMLILLLASFGGARIAAARIKHRRLYVCILSGVVYYSLLLAITALFFGGQYQGMGVTALVVAAGCGTAALLEKNEKKRRRKPRSKAGRR